MRPEISDVWAQRVAAKRLVMNTTDDARETLLRDIDILMRSFVSPRLGFSCWRVTRARQRERLETWRIGGRSNLRTDLPIQKIVIARLGVCGRQLIFPLPYYSDRV